MCDSACSSQHRGHRGPFRSPGSARMDTYLNGPAPPGTPTTRKSAGRRTKPRDSTTAREGTCGRRVRSAKNPDCWPYGSFVTTALALPGMAAAPRGSPACRILKLSEGPASWSPVLLSALRPWPPDAPRTSGTREAPLLNDQPPSERMIACRRSIIGIAAFCTLGSVDTNAAVINIVAM